MPVLTDAHPAVRLADYRPTPFAIRQVDLDISLHDDGAIVRARLTIAPRPGRSGEPLVLDGEELTLHEIAIDGDPLDDSQWMATDQGLTLLAPPARPFVLATTVRIDPAANTKLMGLYRSNGTWCTQCEAEGFRRITYFLDRPDVLATYRVRVEAPRAAAAVLLSNGNPVETGHAGPGRHFAVWDDPWPKPSYLFALVAGNLDAVRDHFVTASGRTVDLAIYVEPGKAPLATYAMDALKRSMAWDETAFSREYDLDVFNVVAVSDFNMGAMENKGLNVFNDKYVLADPDTATDVDYAGIESVIAHEYFHNWTGNRITCRDWFQLCLKEGLTVFRDQEFSADMRSRAVKRIADVRTLRSHQFPEDGGPLAHPVRPDTYKEINNFYTATVYEKGAEVIRMLKALIGEAAFAAGMDLYFGRHDGEAATVEDFIACFADASGRDLGSFMRWYSQAGTPQVSVRASYDAAARRLTLGIEQETPATPGQPTKLPQVIPIRFGLVGSSGNDIAAASVSGAEVVGDVLLIERDRQTVTFDGLDERPIPSLLRGFSAPVRLRQDLDADDLVFLLGRDSDSFNRWQAGTTLSMAALVHATAAIRAGGRADFTTGHFDALGDLAGRPDLDPAYRALLLAVPGDNDVAREIGEDIDPDAIYRAGRAFRTALAGRIGRQLHAAIRATPADALYRPDADGAGRRALVNAALDLLSASGDAAVMADIRRRFETATNMTDRLAALGILVHRDDPAAAAALDGFIGAYGSMPLVVDKWLTVQATAPSPATLDRVRALVDHPAFSMSNPNRVRALIGAFASLNPTQFGRADGAGYAFVAEVIGDIDPANPQLAARLLVSFRSWRSFEPVRRGHAEAALGRLAARPRLSRDVSDILERTLA